MRELYDLSLDELKKRKRLWSVFSLFIAITGSIYLLGGVFLCAYVELMVYSLMSLMMGLTLCLISIWPNNISLMIYLKTQEKK